MKTIEEFSKQAVFNLPLMPAEISKGLWAYQTPKRLLKFGMCFCHNCGVLSSVDDGTCLNCEEVIQVFKKENT